MGRGGSSIGISLEKKGVTHRNLFRGDKGGGGHRDLLREEGSLGMSISMPIGIFLEGARGVPIRISLERKGCLEGCP